MAEVFVEFAEPVEGSDGRRYIARACGSETANGLWQGWIEFVPTIGGDIVRSRRETTQPNREDAMYWATGLTRVYLEGALERSLKPLELAPPEPVRKPAYSGPAPEPVPPSAAIDAVLNPFSVFRKGEAALRAQLAALAQWHLVNIVRAFELSDLSAASLSRMSGAELAELIVAEVRTRSETAPIR